MSDDAPAPSPVTEHKVIGEESESGNTKNRGEQEKQQAFDSFAQTENEDGVNMNVKVYSPSRVYFDDLAFSVTATNDTGEFDVLPKHHNFICLLSACNLVLRTAKQGNHNIAISGGLMHVKADKIIIFLDI